MVNISSHDAERKILAILKVLSESSDSLGSITIARQLERHGIFLSERAVRYHLKLTDERGYTEPLGRDGRSITPLGLEELKSALAPDQVGFILERLELLAFKVNFDPVTKSGLLPINASFFEPDEFKKALPIMKDVYKAKIAVSDYVKVANEGDKMGDIVVPKGKIGFATICSVVINGVLLKAGIPTESRFGGVLEIRNSKPRRFTAIINYNGTSIDPSEQYIRASMTSVGLAAKTGNGRILANFREIPAAARATAETTLERLSGAGINGVYALGNISEPVCQIGVGLNRVGMVLLGGLNPVAAAVEAGVKVENVGESGLVDFKQFTSIWDL